MLMRQNDFSFFSEKYLCCVTESIKSHFIIVCGGKKRLSLSRYYVSPGEYGRPILICKLMFSLEDSSFDYFIGIKVTDSLNHELLDLKGQWFKIFHGRILCKPRPCVKTHYMYG